MRKKFLGVEIGLCLIATYLIVRGYVEYSVVILIIGVVMIAVSKKAEVS